MKPSLQTKDPTADAIEQFMLSAALPIFYDADSTVFAIGTGTLFSIDGRSYVVTADHVTKGLDLEKLASPMGRSRDQICTWGSMGRVPSRGVTGRV